MLQRLLALARAPGELAEAEVAVGDEGAHAELLSERERLLVVLLGALDFGRVAMRGDLAADIEGASLDSARAPFAGEAERPLYSDPGVLQPAGEEIRLAQHGRDVGLGGPGKASGPVGGLLQKRKRLAGSPGHRIRMTKPTGS